MRPRPRLFKRSGWITWGFTFYDPDGRRLYRKTDIPLSSPRKAEKYADEYVEDYYRRNSEIKIKLKDFTTDFFVWGKCSWIKRQHAKGRRFSEAQAYQRRGQLKNHILKQFEDRYIASINRLEVENWLASIPRANATRNQILDTFRIVMREAETAGYIPHNVLERTERFGAADRKERDIFTLEELKRLFPEDRGKLLEIWGSLKHATCFIVIATTGIRTGEARALCWRHNLEGGALLIDQAVKADRTMGATKTGDVRIVLLPGKAQTLLNDWKDSEKNPFRGPDDLLFWGNDRNKPWSSNYLSKYLHPCLERAEVDTGSRNLVCHSFRHTFNTMMRQILPLEILQALTGHKSEAMTQLYDHPTLEDRLKKLQGHKKLIEKVWN
jgi:integrase